MNFQTDIILKSFKILEFTYIRTFVLRQKLVRMIDILDI